MDPDADPDPRIHTSDNMDPNEDPDPVIFVSDLQDFNKNNVFLSIFLLVTFVRYIYIIFQK
jgi:hypothetical protein